MVWCKSNHCYVGRGEIDIKFSRPYWCQTDSTNDHECVYKGGSVQVQCQPGQGESDTCKLDDTSIVIHV